MKYNTWHEGLCTEDHMHSWELRGGEWFCLNATHDSRRDNPESPDMDAYQAVVYCSVCGKPAKLRNGEVVYSEGGIKSPVCYGGCGVQFSDLLKHTVDQYEDAIIKEDERWRNSPFYKIMQQRQAEIRLLYGTMTNYFLVMDYKPQPEGTA